jgi:hypothetical protein
VKLSVGKEVAKVGRTAVADYESTVTDGGVVEIHKLKRLTKRRLGNGLLPGSADFARRRVLWVVGKLEKPESRRRLNSSNRGSRQSSRTAVEGFRKQGVQGRGRVTSSAELAPELLDEEFGVDRRGAEGGSTEDRASNQPVEHTRRVGRTRRKIQVEVQRLLVENVVEPSVLEGDRKIEEHNLV